jgi:chromosome segregation ATPase
MNATTVKKTVTNEDLLGIMQDLMQMTHNGFEKLEGRMDRIEGRMDGLEGRMDGLEGRMGRIESRLTSIEAKLRGHDMQLAELKAVVIELSNKHAAYINDIKDILDRVQRLEERSPDISKEEIRELQRLLQIVVRWAIKTAKTVKVPLDLPK